MINGAIQKSPGGPLLPPEGILATLCPASLAGVHSQKFCLLSGARRILGSGSGMARELRVESWRGQGRAARVSARLRCCGVRLLSSNSRIARHLLINSVAPLSDRKSQV